MKKTLRTLGALALTAITLCSCVSKTTYEKFHEAATSVESISYTKATWKGQYDKESNLNLKLEYTTKTVLGVNVSTWSVTDGENDEANKAIYVAAFTIISASRPSAVAESDSVEYYCGGGFKTVDGSTTTEWNKYGYVTSCKGTDSDGKVTNFTISWSK